MKKKYFLLILFVSIFIISCGSQPMTSDVKSEKTKDNTPFKALILTERGGQHGSFTDEAFRWLDTFSVNNNFEYVEINNTELINKEYLAQFSVVVQLDFPPYTWTDDAQSAFIEYIEQGKGGWVGFHHATLLGEFDGYSMWQWFSDFMGGIRFKNYIAPLASATVYVEDQTHPVMQGVHDSFLIPNDEWYTFDKNPRDNPNIQVLAHVDESSYQPVSDIKMGDHPAIWINKNMKARNVYFLMGHANSLFASEDFKTMFANAILWGAGRTG